ncbi:MAG: Calx-beta domain-containing protein [Anaerolineales bacterium]
MEINTFKTGNHKIKAQGMVEFALVIPILLLLIFGIIEGGRLLWLYSTVLSSSREAARYGAAAGELSGSLRYYADCDGIRGAAMRIGRFAGISSTDISISYDHGPTSGSPFAICPLPANQQIKLADRVVVQVVSNWQPLLPLANFGPFPISAITRRTIIKDVEIEGTPPSPITPTIAFVESGQTVDESAGELRILLQLTAATDKTVSIPFSLDGTAAPGDDYQVSGSPVVILPGYTTAEIVVTITDDDVDEDEETAALIMGSPTNAVRGNPFTHIIKIEDNDDPPEVSFLIADQSFPEDVDNLALLRLSHPSSKDIVVDFDTSGIAQRGVDYTILSSPITIPAMDTTFPIVVDVVDDLIDEEDEPFSITLLSAVNGTIGSPSVHIYTILDNDDPPDVFFTWEQQSGDETVGTMTVELQLTIESAKDITVPFILGGSATRDIDYTIDTTPVFIPAGDTTASVLITVIPDLDDEEGDETITLMIQNPVNANRGTPFKHTATITSDAMEPSVSFASASQSSGNMVDGKLEVKVLLSAAWSEDVFVPFTFAGTATKDLDYTVNAESVVIPAGGASASIYVSFYDDAIDEYDETIEIVMGTPTNATKGVPNVHTITIPDNDPEPLLYLTSSGQTVDEDAGIVTITAQLSVISGKDVTVPYIVLGSATEGLGNDYTIIPSPLVILAGDQSVDILVEVLEDDLIELDEDVIVTLGTPTNAVLSSPGTHTLVIKDNEPNCPTPTALPYFGTNTNGDILTWSLQSPNPIVPVNLVSVTVHWPVASAANITGITFGSPIYTGNAAPPHLAVNSPNPVWSGAFNTRDMIFIFSRTPKSVAGDYYQIIATFAGCAPVSGIIPSD